MKKVIAFLQDYLVGGVSDGEMPPAEIRMPDGDSLSETGPDIIAKVTSLIALRRPVLLTGPGPGRIMPTSQRGRSRC